MDESSMLDDLLEDLPRDERAGAIEEKRAPSGRSR
jgi:hypothetical protein